MKKHITFLVFVLTVAFAYPQDGRIITYYDWQPLIYDSVATDAYEKITYYDSAAASLGDTLLFYKYRNLLKWTNVLFEQIQYYDSIMKYGALLRKKFDID